MNIEKMAEMLEKEVYTAMKNPPPASEEVPHLSTSINFTEEETANMSEEFKQEFEQNGRRVARMIKYNFGYEIRYRRNGFNVTVFHEDLAAAKQLLIAEALA